MISIIRLLCWKLPVLLCGLTVCGQSKTIDSMLIVLFSAKQDTNKVKIFNELAEKYISINNTSKAMEYADSSEVMSSILNYKTGKANAIVLKGQAESKKGNRENAVVKYKIAADLFREMGNKISEAEMFSNVASELAEKDNYAEALRYSTMALKIYEVLNNKEGLMNTYLGIGTIYRYMANYQLSLKNILIAMKMARETNTKNVQALALRSLSVIYQYEKKQEAAVNSALESIKIFEELGDKTGIASGISSLGVTYAQQEKYDESINLFYKARDIYSELGDRQNTAYMNNQIGVVKSMQNKLDEALDFYRYALQQRREINDKWGVAESEIYIGSLLSKQAVLLNENNAKINYDSAIFYISNAALVMKEIGYKQSEQSAYRRLSEIYVALKDYKKALDYKEMHLKIRDSIMNNELLSKLEQQRVQFEVERAVTEEKTQKEKAIEFEKLKFEFALAEEQAKQEKLFAAQQFESERRMAYENARHQQQLAEEKAAQQVKDAQSQALLDKGKTENKRRTDAFIAGLAGLSILSLFIIVFIRQRIQKQRAIDKAEAGHKMAELELQSLRAQLNPHFMFNSLNAIQDLILKEDNDKSHLYLSRFAKLLRVLLDNANQPFVTVKQELELLELYLSLENLRIPNLQYSIEKDPKLNASERMIPNMMLQPYIENAIWHGLSHKKGERKLRIRIHENGSSTKFEVEDNGIGRNRSAELKQQFRHGHHSKGMQLLSKRFELLSNEYGDTIRTQITDLQQNGEATGTLVRIDVPFNLSEQAFKLAHDQNHHN